MCSHTLGALSYVFIGYLQGGGSDLGELLRRPSMSQLAAMWESHLHETRFGSPEPLPPKQEAPHQNFILWSALNRR